MKAARKKHLAKAMGQAIDGWVKTIIAVAFYEVLHSWVHVSIGVAIVAAVGYLVTN